METFTYLTATEAACLLRTEPATVVQLCRVGHIEAAKPLGTWLIQPEAVEAFVAAAVNEVSQ